MRPFISRKAMRLSNQRLYAYCCDVALAIQKIVEQNELLNNDWVNFASVIDNYTEALNQRRTTNFTKELNEYGQLADIYFKAIKEMAELKSKIGEKPESALKVLECFKQRNISTRDAKNKRYADYTLTMQDLMKTDEQILKEVGVKDYVNDFAITLERYFEAREKRSSYKVTLIGRTIEARKHVEESLDKLLTHLESLASIHEDKPDYEQVCKVLNDKLYPYFEHGSKSDSEEEEDSLDNTDFDDNAEGTTEAPSIDETPFTDESTLG